MDEVETTTAEGETTPLAAPEHEDETPVEPPPELGNRDALLRRQRIRNIVVGGVVGGVGAVVLAPVVLAAAGFGAAGVVAGSATAAAQSSIIGSVAAGITGWFTRRRNNNRAGPTEDGTRTGTDSDNGGGGIGSNSSGGSSDSMDDSKNVKKSMENTSVMQETQTDFEFYEDHDLADQLAQVNDDDVDVGFEDHDAESLDYLEVDGHIRVTRGTHRRNSSFPFQFADCL